MLKRALRLNLNDIFDGHWLLTKKVDGESFFEGNAHFIPAANGGAVAYREEGKVRHKSGYTGDGFREYHFQIIDSESTFSVYFDHQCQKLFHSVSLKQKNGIICGIARHLCVNDTYISQYQFPNTNHWTLDHEVVGPRKNYLIHAQYRRCDETP